MPGNDKLPVYRIYQFAWTAIDWIYPPQCAGCNVKGYRWCPECVGRTKKFSHQQCHTCGRLQDSPGRCKECEETPRNFDQVRSWAELKGPLRNAILRLKYQRDYGLGDVMMAPLVEIITGMGWQIDMIVPVPLGKKRLLERGYNQAASLAKPLSWSLKLLYKPKALRRIRETVSQIGLSKIERKRNVFGAFDAKEEIVAGMRILIVDDVMTTGATLEACALALKQANAEKVYGVTLSRAVNTRDIL